MYNLMGIILEAQVPFFRFYAFLKKKDLVMFKPYTLEETVIEKALHANECER